MFIKLTNNSPELKGTSLIINTQLILTVYTGEAVRSEDTTETTTFVYGGQNGTWEVEESVDDVFALLAEEEQLW